MMKSEGKEAEWLYEQMRAYNAGKLRLKPRLPPQHGSHIDSLPRERNEPARLETAIKDMKAAK